MADMMFRHLRSDVPVNTRSKKSMYISNEKGINTAVQFAQIIGNTLICQGFFLSGHKSNLLNQR